MEKSIEVTGKTIDAAIESALAQLGADRDRVSIEVLEKPKSGFLGLGGSLARVKATLALNPAELAADYLEGLLSRMGAPARPSVTEREDGRLSIELVGDGDLGLLIGRRGETLDAIQHLTNNAVNRNLEAPVRVMVDVENYREKRLASLERLAHKVASKVIRDHRNIMLEPMNAFERHIIHAALQDREGVNTFSVGNEPNRQVVVASTQPQKAPPGRADFSRGAYNTRGGNNSREPGSQSAYGDRNGRYGGNRPGPSRRPYDGNRRPYDGNRPRYNTGAPGHTDNRPGYTSPPPKPEPSDGDGEA